MKRSNGIKWAYVAITALLLATIVRGCAPKYNETNAQPTNKKSFAYNYSEYFDNISDQMDKINETKEKGYTM